MTTAASSGPSASRVVTLADLQRELAIQRKELILGIRTVLMRKVTTMPGLTGVEDQELILVDDGVTVKLVTKLRGARFSVTLTAV